MRAMTTEEEFWNVLGMPLLAEGTVVEYHGSIEAARPELWKVAAQIGDDRYTLASTRYEWERLNVSRDEVRVHDCPEGSDHNG